MRNQTHYSVYDFSTLEDMPFSAIDYSSLKFGCNEVAKRFGYELAEKFFSQNYEKLTSGNFVVIPSPYNYVTNAATSMSKHFVHKLNHLLAFNGGKSVDSSFIHRKVTYTGDFGFLNKEEREKLINQDSFYINKDFLEGKTIIVLDDVKITGAHEDKINAIFDEQNITNDTFFIYYGNYLKRGVGADIEGAINFAAIKNIDDYIALAQKPSYNLIVRPIKYLFRRTEYEFQKAINALPTELVQEIYYGCLGENYHLLEENKVNFDYISNHEKITGVHKKEIFKVNIDYISSNDKITGINKKVLSTDNIN